MKFQNLLIGIVIFACIVMSSALFMNDVGTQYGKSIDDYGYVGNMSKDMNKTIMISNQLRDSLTIMTTRAGITTMLIPYDMMVTSWRIVKLMWGSFGIVNDVFSNSGNVLTKLGIPIPTWMIGVILAIITITIVMIAISSWLKWRLEE